MSLVLRPACTACPLRWRPGKATLLRANRLLAWALVVSPALQVALGTDFWRGLWLDLAILAAHAGLSLAIFGLPPGIPRGFLAIGFAEYGMSERARFLLTGWRVALPFLYAVLLSVPLLLVPVLWLVVALPLLLFWIALPFNLAAHIFQAAHYALRRWRLKAEDARDAVAMLLVAAFFWASAVNLVR